MDCWTRPRLPECCDTPEADRAPQRLARNVEPSLFAQPAATGDRALARALASLCIAGYMYCPLPRLSGPGEVRPQVAEKQPVTWISASANGTIDGGRRRAGRAAPSGTKRRVWGKCPNMLSTPEPMVRGRCKRLMQLYVIGHIIKQN